MQKDQLKQRAKCLRNAISSMLKIEISHSQSLELVAREENYPNWDAAVASCKTTNSRVECDEPLHLDVLLRKGHYENLDDLLKEPWFICQLRDMLDLNRNEGGLLLITGITGNGKTTTIKHVVNDIVLRAGKNIKAYHHGIPEFRYPLKTDVRFQQDGEELIDALLTYEDLVVIDDIRTEQDLTSALLLADRGRKAIAVLHAKSPVNRIQTLLEKSHNTIHLFNDLVSQRKIMTVRQSFDLLFLD